MKRLVTYLIISCFALVLAGSCKKLSVDTVYRLTVEWQERKGQGDTVPLSTAKAYAFFADPEQWEVTNEIDARNGVITKIGDPTQKRGYDEAPAGIGKYGNQFEFKFNGAPVMLVVADTKQPMWATGNANIVPDLPNMYVNLKFKPLDWKTSDSIFPIVKKPWKFYGYQNVVIPIETKLQVVPVVWRIGEASSTILQSAGCYAFYGVTKKTKGIVTSWENARDGVVNTTDSIGNVIQKNFDVRGEWKNDSLLMQIDNPYIMVVAYNELPSETGGRKIYAYTFFDLVDNPTLKTSKLLFNLRELPPAKDTMVVADNWTILFGKPENARR